MTDDTQNTTQTQTAASAPAAAKPKRTHGDIDQRILADIKLSEDISTTAKEPDRATKLVDEGLPATAGTDLEAAAKSARNLASQLIIARKARMTATKAESDACKSLLMILRDFQQRAKRILPTGDPKRSAYCINKKNFGSDRQTLEQDADTIIKLASADALPGLKAEKLAAAGTALTGWRTADQTQRKADETQGRLARQFEKAVADMNAKRRQVQLAADTAWPHTDPANAATRRLFKIPAGQPVG